jgi:hypothetical protein
MSDSAAGAFVVTHSKNAREGFAPYEYEIRRGNGLVARYWHDYRGDESWIEFADGSTEEWPHGSSSSFLAGGGPQPLGLTEKALAYLTQKLG